MNIAFDPQFLRNAAVRLMWRSRYVALLYGFVGFCIGVGVGSAAMVQLNMARRVNQLKNANQLSEMVNPEERGDELRGAFRRVPLAGFSGGIFVAAMGLMIGWRKSFDAKTQAQMALGIAEIHSR